MSKWKVTFKDGNGDIIAVKEVESHWAWNAGKIAFREIEENSSAEVLKAVKNETVLLTQEKVE